MILFIVLELIPKNIVLNLRVYKNAPIVILDEPTAALDPKAEYDIYTKFLSMVNTKTSIFISHRLSSTKFCDRIVVMRGGKIIEIGNHFELLAQNGYYAELFNLQAQYYIDEADKKAVSI